MQKKWCLAIFLVLLMPYSYAANVHGTVYDLDLRPAKDAVITVDSVPLQTLIAKDGTFSFNLPVGSYLLTATLIDGSSIFVSQQNLVIRDDGDYVSDMILLPDLAAEENLLNDNLSFSPLDIPRDSSKTLIYIILGFIVVIVIVVVAFLAVRKLRKKLPVDASMADEVLAFIKSHDGRTTQKDIRKQFPVSEAKISLVITELEHKGIVEKVKKGKGNIVILKRS
ncbi:MAG: hypothetical protein V1837_03305 [Candidatus Woesearchaeota archaeon]